MSTVADFVFNVVSKPKSRQLYKSGQNLLLMLLFVRVFFFFSFLSSMFNQYSSPNIIRVIKSRRLRWAGHVVRMGERRGAYRALVGKPEGWRPLGRPRRRWEDNIKMDIREVGWGGAQTGLIWLRIGTGGGLLCIRWWTFGFHKMRGISWVA
jgi:hypothetical protein